jgi:hypothetical protein
MNTFASLVVVLIVIVGQCYSTPLDDYVRAPDPNFSWSVIRSYEQPDYTLYILNFTSQKWLDGLHCFLVDDDVYRHSN